VSTTTPVFGRCYREWVALRSSMNSLIGSLQGHFDTKNERST
jgi:hypothetical protein